VPGNDERLGHQAHHLPPQRVGGAQPTGGAAQDDEFVPAEAGDQVGLEQPAAQAPRHLGDQFVAHVVAHGVVHGLERIEIDISDEHVTLPALRALPDRARQFLAQSLGKVEAIGQTRHRIVQRVVLRLGLAELQVLRGLAHAPYDHHAPGQNRQEKEDPGGQQGAVPRQIVGPGNCGVHTK
jgi:hypothetical protein